MEITKEIDYMLYLYIGYAPTMEQVDSRKEKHPDWGGESKECLLGEIMRWVTKIITCCSDAELQGITQAQIDKAFVEDSFVAGSKHPETIFIPESVWRPIWNEEHNRRTLLRPAPPSVGIRE